MKCKLANLVGQNNFSAVFEICKNLKRKSNEKLDVAVFHKFVFLIKFQHRRFYIN